MPSAVLIPTLKSFKGCLNEDGTVIIEAWRTEQKNHSRKVIVKMYENDNVKAWRMMHTHP